jgi:hypothetical protein
MFTKYEEIYHNKKKQVNNILLQSSFNLVKRINVSGERYTNRSLANNSSSLRSNLFSRTKSIARKRRHKRSTFGTSSNQ